MLKDARGVGKNLDASADFLDLRGRFEDVNIVPGEGATNCGAETGKTSSDNDDL